MKRHLSSIIAIIILVAALATTAQSQGTNSRLLRARIPFAFHVGAKELPAGEYRISVLNPSSDRRVLQIRSVDGRVSAITNTVGRQAANAPANSKLVFHRYGNTYFFAQAEVAGDSTTLAAMKSSAETKEARMIASHGGSVTVTIAAE
jgi:hypothetical protein